MGEQFQKFSTQVDSEKLARLRAIAKEDGRQIRSVLDEALDIYLKRRQPKGMRPDVLEAYNDVVSRYSETLKKLAE
jgi:ATP-dependent 26S proteasome regulatory subunit